MCGQAILQGNLRAPTAHRVALATKPSSLHSVLYIIDQEIAAHIRERQHLINAVSIPFPTEQDLRTSNEDQPQRLVLN
jgi:hypothetical protein